MHFEQTIGIRPAVRHLEGVLHLSAGPFEPECELLPAIRGFGSVEAWGVRRPLGMLDAATLRHIMAFASPQIKRGVATRVARRKWAAALLQVL